MKLITIVIPVFNEEKHITDCIHSVLAFKVPDQIQYEIWVIDGGSTDKTRNIIKSIQINNDSVQLMDNPGKTQSFAMNIAIQKSKADWIMRLDGHAIYPQSYLIDLVQTAVKTGAENVGGVWDVKNQGNTLSDYLVHALITHPFGVGNSGFRSGLKSGPVDTVPFGFFKKSIFDEIGLFDERLVRAQDYEFNQRMITSGYKVWLNPDIIISYFQKGTLLKVLWKYASLEAPYNAYMWYLAPYTFSWRHLITLMFISGLIIGGFLSLFSPWIKIIYLGVLYLYGFLAISFSFQKSFSDRKPILAVMMPFVFLSFHVLHGLGVLVGIVKLIFKMAPVQKGKQRWTLADKLINE